MSLNFKIFNSDFFLSNINIRKYEYDIPSTLFVEKNDTTYYFIFVNSGIVTYEIQGTIYSISCKKFILLQGSNLVKIIPTFNDPPNFFLITFKCENPNQLNIVTNHMFQLKEIYNQIFDSIFAQIKKIEYIKKAKPSITYDNVISDFYISTYSIITNLIIQLLLRMHEEILSNSLPGTYLEDLNIIESHEAVKSSQFSSVIEKKQIHYSNELINEIIIFMNFHIDKNLTIDDFAENFLISSASLKKLFKKITGNSIINYFIRIKMQNAEKLIRENQLSYTEIAEKLGYGSIHHFSAAFKKYSGYSPSKYFSTIQPGYVENIDEVSSLLNQHFPNQ